VFAVFPVKFNLRICLVIASAKSEGLILPAALLRQPWHAYIGRVLTLAGSPGTR
jgi:hypothetical protein